MVKNERDYCIRSDPRMPSWRPQTTLPLLQERKASEPLSIKLRRVTDNACTVRVHTEY